MHRFHKKFLVHSQSQGFFMENYKHWLKKSPILSKRNYVKKSCNEALK